MSQTIQWFPGHMAKAKREAIEKRSLVDVVLEIVDARIPESSRNPMIAEIIGNKPSIIVLNKSDMADSKSTQEWIEYYQKHGKEAIAIDALHQQGITNLKKAIKNQMKDYFKKQEEKGIKPRAIRLMILGIPNVGKSTLINRFVGKNQAITGNKPGVTKAQRWLKINKEFELLDTPGILWPKFEDPIIGQRLAITGAIKDTILHADDIALALLKTLIDHDKASLLSKYHISNNDIENLNLSDLLLKITKNIGLKDNYEEASIRLLTDFRNGKLGNVTLDVPGKSINEYEND